MRILCYKKSIPKKKKKRNYVLVAEINVHIISHKLKKNLFLVVSLVKYLVTGIILMYLLLCVD